MVVLTLGIFILAVLSLYWGSLFGVEQNLPSITAWIVDFDGQIAPYNTTTTPIVGPFVTKTFSELHPNTYDRLGWTIMSPQDFDNDPMVVRQRIYDEEAYLAIIINANATALLRAAVNEGNSSYDPTGAAQVIYVTARDETTTSSYILPALLDTLVPIAAQFGGEWTQILSRNASTQNVFRTPQAVNPAIGFSFIDLRPFVPAAATPSVTIGLIYLIIISFFSFAYLMPIHMQFVQTKGTRPLHPLQLMAWRILSNIAAYGFLSLCYSLVSLAFQIPFSNPPAPGTVGAQNSNGYGRGSFVVFWMLNWVGMAALGLPSENMAMILGMPYASMWLIFWVISNVATGFYSLDLAPGFFAWGYAWPLHRSTLNCIGSIV
jgi:hypothetical protein